MSIWGLNARGHHSVPVGDKVIVVSDVPMLDVLYICRLRWGMDSVFSPLKSRGLNTESMPMTTPE